MPKFSIYLKPEEHARLENAATREGKSKNKVARSFLSPVIHGDQSSVLQAYRLWNIDAALHALERELARERTRHHDKLQLLARPRVPKFYRTLLKQELHGHEATMLAIEAEIRILREEAANLRPKPRRTTKAAPRAAPACAPSASSAPAHALPGEGPHMTTPAFIFLGLSTTQTTVIALLVLAAGGLLGLAIFKRHALRRMLHKRHEDRRHRPRARPHNAEDAVEGLMGTRPPANEEVVYPSLDEYRRQFLHSAVYLRRRIDEFLEQPDSFERLKQWCEDTDFEARGPRNESTRIRFFVFTESQFRRLPDELKLELLSQRSRNLASINPTGFARDTPRDSMAAAAAPGPAARMPASPPENLGDPIPAPPDDLGAEPPAAAAAGARRLVVEVAAGAAGNGNGSSHVAPITPPAKPPVPPYKSSQKGKGRRAKGPSQDDEILPPPEGADAADDFQGAE